MDSYKKYILFFILISSINFAFTQVFLDSIKNPKVGLALSGGGAKGFAHVEIIEAIEKAGIRIDYISGTSIGAIVGSLYSSGYSSKDIKKIIEKVDFTELFFQEKNRNFIPFIDKSYRNKYIISLPIYNSKINLPSAISKGQGSLLLLTDLLSNVHDINDYSKLPIPFVCIATNLETGKEEKLETGFLPLSVLASGAYPSLIEPIKIDDKILIDGAIVNNFPAKILKDKGMDIVIGVDIGSGLLKSSDINSIFSVINQIISYRINIKTNFERSYVDVLIKPDLEKYSVTDFNKKDSIINKGKIAAQKAFPMLKKIASMQFPDTIKKEIKNNDPFLEREYDIESIKITGEKKYDLNQIKRKMNIKIPGILSKKDINRGVSALYSTGNYNRVYYKLLKDSTENNKINLTLDLNNNKYNNFLKFGLHYDDVYKSGLLANLTLNKFIFKNGSLSFDVILSNNFRSYINYFIDNGIYPSIGINSNFNSINLDISDTRKNEYPFRRIRNFYTQIYIQKTIIEKYAIGGGLQYNYTFITPFNNLNSNFKKINSYFFDPYFYIKADTRDNAYFPFKGINLDASFRHILFSNVNDNNSSFEKYSFFKAQFNHSISLFKNFAIENQLFLGASFNKPPLEYKYFLGGYFEQNLNNFKNFLGLPLGYASGNQMFSLYTSLNYRFFKNNYLKIYGNFANLEDDFNDLQYFNYKYTSYGFGYGYYSPFGPLSLQYTRSLNLNKNIFYITLGYWF